MVDKFNLLNQVLLVVTIVVMFIVLLAQIFTRFIFFIPLPSSQDILVFLLLTSVFLGAGTAVAAHRHIALEFVVTALPPKVEKMVLIFADIVSIIFLIIVVNQSFQLMDQVRGTIVGASPIPAEGYYLVVLIGCLIMILNYVNDLIKKLFVHDSKEEHR